MKHLFYSAALLLSLTACGSKADDPAAPTDPFLGHWVCDGWTATAYDATGKPGATDTYKNASSLDITPTTMTWRANTMGGAPTTDVYTYSRNGEVLTFQLANPGNEKNYARNLTATAFTLEIVGTRGKGTYTNAFPFHR